MLTGASSELSSLLQRLGVTPLKRTQPEGGQERVLVKLAQAPTLLPHIAASALNLEDLFEELT